MNEPVVYEMVTEKPLEFVAYRVRDFDNDPTVDINSEARHCATLPGVESASVEYGWAGKPALVVKFHDNESVRMGMGGWIVIRSKLAPLHPLDIVHAEMRDISGRVMTYNDAEFRERYNVPETTKTRNFAGEVVHVGTKVPRASA